MKSFVPRLIIAQSPSHRIALGTGENRVDAIGIQARNKKGGMPSPWMELPETLAEITLVHIAGGGINHGEEIWVVDQSGLRDALMSRPEIAAAMVLMKIGMKMLGGSGASAASHPASTSRH